MYTCRPHAKCWMDFTFGEMRRSRSRERVKQKFKNLIKRGWPGKDEKVLERQTELVTVLFYGFVDHVVHIPKTERTKILRDFRNMLNLHLQDRKFF